MKIIISFLVLLCLTNSCTKKNVSSNLQQNNDSKFSKEYNLILSVLDTLIPQCQNYFVITRHTCSKCIAEISERMQNNNISICVIPIGFEAVEVARLNFLYNRRGIYYRQVDNSLLEMLEQSDKSFAVNLQLGIKKKSNSYEIYNVLEHMEKEFGVVSDSLAHFFLTN